MRHSERGVVRVESNAILGAGHHREGVTGNEESRTLRKHSAAFAGRVGQAVTGH